MKIKKLREAIRPDAPKILIYGESGVGKTTLVGSLPGRVLILSAEAGLLSLAYAAADDRFDVVEVASINDVREAYKILRAPGHGGYSWVVLDSISEISEVVLAAAKKAAPDPRQAYGAILDEIPALVRSFRDLPGIGVLVVAKAAKVKDEISGRILVGPSAPGSKLGDMLPYLFDEVFRLVVVDEVEDGQKVPVRRLQTSGDAKAVAKDRSGALDALEVADLGAVVEKITQHVASLAGDGTPGTADTVTADATE